MREVAETKAFSRTSWHRFRIQVIGFLLGLGFFILIGRAYQLQIYRHDKLFFEAFKAQIQKISLTHDRGPIVDINSIPLAVSAEVMSAYAEPNHIKEKDREKTSEKVSEILGLKKDFVLHKISLRGGFVWLKRLLPHEQAKALAALKLPGIGLIRETDRAYPYSEVAAHLIGFTGTDCIGLEGLERTYDQVLKGDPGFIIGERDALGGIYFPNGFTVINSRKGNGLKLTIDVKLQFFAEQALEKIVAEYQPEVAVSIIQEPSTGKILAMAARPTFNPNEFQKSQVEARKNFAIANVYEPGSTFKPFTVAAALNEGVVKPTDIYNCEMGHFAVGPAIIHDCHPYGALTVADVVKVSSNIGAAKIAFKLGKDPFYEYLHAYGFGALTELGIPGESSGMLQDSELVGKVGLATQAFGQGIAMTPLQLINAFDALVNGGKLMTPYVVSAVLDSEGREVQRFGPHVKKTILTPETSRTITDIMTLVTGPGGTGKKAAIPGFNVAGKTGTAQKILPGGGYHPTARISSFVGTVPAEDPKLTILVMIDDPKGPQGVRYGGVCAAPAWKEIAEQSLAYLKIFGNAEPQPELKKWSIAQAKGTQESTMVTASNKISSDANRMLGNGRMPNLMGLSMRSALQLADEVGVSLTIQGSGVVVSQYPRPGDSIPENGNGSVIFALPSS